MHGLNKPKGMGKLTAENQFVTRTNFSLFSIANLFSVANLRNARSFLKTEILKI